MRGVRMGSAICRILSKLKRSIITYVKFLLKFFCYGGKVLWKKFTPEYDLFFLYEIFKLVKNKFKHYITSDE